MVKDKNIGIKTHLYLFEYETLNKGSIANKNIEEIDFPEKKNHLNHAVFIFYRTYF